MPRTPRTMGVIECHMLALLSVGHAQAGLGGLEARSPGLPRRPPSCRPHGADEGGERCEQEAASVSCPALHCLRFPRLLLLLLIVILLTVLPLVDLRQELLLLLLDIGDL